MIAFGAAIAVIVGMTLVVFARRPHADDVYTRCVLCGYDVSGRAGADRCSECGEDLTAPRATVVVERTTVDHFRLGVGLLLVVVGFVAFLLSVG